MDEFIEHTKNLAKLAHDKGDTQSEVFFNSVLVYVYQYMNIFKDGIN